MTFCHSAKSDSWMREGHDESNQTGYRPGVGAPHLDIFLSFLCITHYYIIIIGH
jgi:hypothetical protein